MSSKDVILLDILIFFIFQHCDVNTMMYNNTVKIDSHRYEKSIELNFGLG